MGNEVYAMPFCQLPQQTSAHLHNKQIYNETKIKLGYPREQQRTLPFDNNYTRFELLEDEKIMIQITSHVLKKIVWSLVPF